MDRFARTGRALAAAGCLALLLLIARAAHSSAFGSGNVVVYRVGDGTTAISDTGTKVFLDEYSPSGGSPIQTIELPSSSAVNLIAGASRSEGMLTRSADGRFLLLTGYQSTLGVFGGLANSAVPRVVGRMGADGVVDLSTQIPKVDFPGDPRSATSLDGTDIWLTGGSSGVRYTQFGGSGATSIASTPSTPRQVHVADGQLYVSATQPDSIKLARVGTGLPTSSGQTVTNISSTFATGSYAAFVFLDLSASVAGVDTLYLACESPASVLKFCLEGGSWVARGSLSVTVSGPRGLAAAVSGSTVTLYATRNAALLKATDTSGYAQNITGSFAVLASVTGNAEFRGVALTPNTSTAVRLESFEAATSASGTELRWRTGYEADNLGFHVYRVSGDERVRLNSELIPGAALSGMGRTEGSAYTFRDPGGGGAYLLEDVDLWGHSTLHGPFYARAGARTPTPAAKGDAIPAAPRPVPRAWVPLSPAPRVTSSYLAGGPWLKIEVREEGIYRLAGADLRAAGLPANVEPRGLRLFTEGREAAIRVDGTRDGRLDPEDAVWFYGLGRETRYSRSRVYWLTWGRAPGRRMALGPARVSGAAPEAFPFTVEARERTVYFASLQNGAAENFFGAPVTASGMTRTFQLAAMAPQSAGLLAVTLQGVTALQAAADHQVAVLLNGEPLGQVVWDGQGLGRQAFSLAPGLLREGANEVTLRAEGPAPDVSLVESVRLTYLRRYEADPDGLRFTASGASRVRLGGLGGAPEILDVTDPENPIRPSWEREGTGIAVNVPGRPRETRLLLAVPEGGSPERPIEKNLPSGWSETRNGADLVVITPREWVSAAEPLRAAREGQGLRTSIVPLDDVYDEFNWGHAEAAALRRFLQYAHARWRRRPEFALLVGDASYDPKDYLGFGPVIGPPTGAVDAGTLETASDDWLADFDGDGAPELALGRVPTRTLAETERVLERLAEWKPAAGAPLFAADLPDTYPFGSASARAASAFGGGSEPWVRTGGGGDRPALLGRVAAGPRLVSYSGHGSIDFWRGGLLTNADAAGLPGPGGAVWSLMTCLNGYFASPTLPCLGERLVQENAAAAWASSGYCDPEAQDRAQQVFMRGLASGLAVGQAARRAKQQTPDRDLRLTWVLLGDPTLRLVP